MKKLIRLTESQLIKFIKNIIKESTFIDKSDFKSDKIGDFKLVETDDTIEYQLLKNNVIRFTIKFFKRIETDKNKIQIICNNINDKASYDMVNFFDSDLEEFQSKSEIIDTGTEYYIEYMIDSNSIEKFKRIVENNLSEIELD